MRFLKNVSACLFVVLFITACATTSGVEVPGHWLNGTWQGPVQRGGELTMTLQVVNVNEITGSGRVMFAGKLVANANVEGKVNGKTAEFGVVYQNSVTRYRLTLQDDGTMTGLAEKFKVTFKRV